MSNALFHRCRNSPLPQARGRVGERLSIPLRTWLLTGVAALALLDPTLARADPVGTAGAANVLSSGTPPGGSMRVIEMGARVVSDEKIDTSPSGSVQLVFIDKTTLDIGPNSSIVIDKFVFDPQAARGEMAVSLVRQERPDVVLCMTDPPIIADVALLVARRFRAPLVVVSQDVFPEAAVELKRLENPFIIGFLRIAIRFYLERAEGVLRNCHGDGGDFRGDDDQLEPAGNWDS